MAPKQDPKPKFQEGNKLSVLISTSSVVSVSAEAVGNVHNFSIDWNNIAAVKLLALLAFIVVHKKDLIIRFATLIIYSSPVSIFFEDSVTSAVAYRQRP